MRQSQAGVASLVAVLFGMGILSAIMISIYSYTLILTRQATRFNTSETALVSAESALYETVVWIKEYPTQVVLDTPVTYQLGLSDITRSISKSGSVYVIEITATLRGMSSTIKAHYEPDISLTYDEVE